MTASGPAMSVLLVTPGDYATVRRTVRFLAAQTAAARLEVLLIGPDEGAFRDVDLSMVAKFFRWQTLAVGPIREVERAFAAGVKAANAPVVALLENHVYPDPQWAELLLESHEGPWTVVGCVVRNANPETATSWVAHFLSYGLYHEGILGGETGRVARNNSTFKRPALLQFGDRLADVLARDGGIMDLLKRAGHRFYLQPAAQLEHLNPSRPSSELALRFLSGRATAGTRVRLERWPVSRRLGYILALPVLPLLRLRGRWGGMARYSSKTLFRVAPFLALALLVDAMGQAVGFAGGAGDSSLAAGHYDLQRLPHLTVADRARFAE